MHAQVAHERQEQPLFCLVRAALEEQVSVRAQVRQQGARGGRIEHVRRRATLAPQLWLVRRAELLGYAQLARHLQAQRVHGGSDLGARGHGGSGFVEEPVVR